MNQSSKPTNQHTVTVEVNGQQNQLIERLVQSDALGRSPEEIIRRGFLEFAKQKRLSRD